MSWNQEPVEDSTACTGLEWNRNSVYEDGGVFVFNTHQSPWYPGTGDAEETGKGGGAGTTMNCPFPAGSGRAEIMGAFQSKLVPAMEKFRPELVMISAGSDSREGDPLGQFMLTDGDFRDLTGIVRDIARKTAEGRVVSMLEGGYNLARLASAATAHVAALLDEGPLSRGTPNSPETRRGN